MIQRRLRSGVEKARSKEILFLNIGEITTFKKNGDGNHPSSRDGEVNDIEETGDNCYSYH